MNDVLTFVDYKSSGYDFDNIFGSSLNIEGGNQNSNGDLGGFLLRASPENKNTRDLGFFSNLLDIIAPDNYDPNAPAGSPNSVSGTWLDRYIAPSDNDDGGVSFGTKSLIAVGVIVIGVVVVSGLMKKL